MKSILKKIIILVLAVIIIWFISGVIYGIRKKLVGIDAEIEFEAKDTEVKVISVMSVTADYYRDDIDYRDDAIDYSNNILRLKKKCKETGDVFYKITLEAYGKENVFYIDFHRTSGDSITIWKQKMIIEISNNEELSIVAKENDNCESFRPNIKDGRNCIEVIEKFPIRK